VRVLISVTVPLSAGLPLLRFETLTLVDVRGCSVCGLAVIGTAQASPVLAAGMIRAEGWSGPGCVPVSVVKYSDGSVWGVEDCGGLERRILLGHA
jgi:hypothetical protein